MLRHCAFCPSKLLYCTSHLKFILVEVALVVESQNTLLVGFSSIHCSKKLHCCAPLTFLFDSCSTLWLCSCLRALFGRGRLSQCVLWLVTSDMTACKPGGCCMPGPIMASSICLSLSRDANWLCILYPTITIQETCRSLGVWGFLILWNLGPKATLEEGRKWKRKQMIV